MHKIILDCDLMRYRDSGLYHYCLNLGTYVKRMLDKENNGSIDFYVPAAEKGAFGPGAGCIIEKKWHQKFMKPFLWDCDIWHAPFQSGRIVPAANKKIKILLTIHDLNCLHEGKSVNEQRQSLQKTQQLIDRSHALVCISNHCKKDVLENMDLKDKPVYVIHNGTHHVNIPPARPTGYFPARPFLFTMGYVNQKKNFHTLISLLKDEGLELIVAGKLDDADYVQKMKLMAAKEGAADRLHILGPVTEADKAWYLKNCQAFLMPSLAEGFGAPVVEAMAFGKPLFLANRTSLPEIGADVAFYFNDFSSDHMQQVFKEGMMFYQQNGLAQKIINRGNDFSWEEKAQDYLKVYRSLL
ncbi:MAG: glycosyltransferase family 4 protein [Chitinophagaceae bacterium]|nr:glycosyltransferase family 4 protein [Chitinophagaceae bacterium]